MNFILTMWLFPVALAVHIGEEFFGLAKWYQKNFKEVPPSSSVSIPVFLVFGWVVTTLTTAWLTFLGDSHLAAWIILLLATPILWNAAEHITQTIIFHQYIPAVITSVIFLVPTISYLFYQAYSARLVPVWYVAVLLVVVCVGTIHVVVAGKNNLTFEVLPFHKIGLYLAGKLGLDINAE
ncbi:HXXEE domain-containing protein [Fischerella sp. PCC 9605]|uniref:HXXEE domain-containing protein n=1 Tax=Fischerella sp. PCC 9605 TaxID=1173024 RepID=UPI00047D05C3|nr:HXXEE domain-containing protein [Fischerella sp. PCC 9605]